MANIAQMVNVLQSMIRTDGARMVLTPTYYAFLMYRPFQGATALPVQVTSPDYAAGTARLPAIDASAARGADSATYVGLVNADPNQEVVVSLALAGVRPGQVTGQLLTAAKMDSRNEFGRPEQVHPVAFHGARWSGTNLQVRMPAKSVVVLTLK
jgi:alpha-N-arabinofuranosidase